MPTRTEWLVKADQSSPKALWNTTLFTKAKAPSNFLCPEKGANSKVWGGCTRNHYNKRDAPGSLSTGNSKNLNSVLAVRAPLLNHSENRNTLLPGYHSTCSEAKTDTVELLQPK